MNPTKKDYERFEKKLTSILKDSASAKAWSDLLPITKEILTHLSKNQNLEFSKISNKHMLAKRLAQCLNPECPGGVHEVVLDIYQIILHNIIDKNETRLMDNLGIYACGLFPFFPNASLQNKEKYLDIIVKKNLLCIDNNELTLCLPGLLASLIPGLDDNNDKTTNLIYAILEDLRMKLKDKIFFGVYWTLILRNKHLRLSGMKYLMEKTEKYKDINKNISKDEIIKNYYPNINTVVVNALCEVIEENDIPTVRLGMDFIITRFPLNKENDLISDEAKVILIISSLKLLVKNEYSTTRRLNNWLLGINSADDDIDFESDDMKYKICLIVKALKKIFNKDKIIKPNELKDNLKVIEQLLAQQIEFTDEILHKVSYDILKCVVNYWQINLNSSENVNKDIVINKVSAFFTKDIFIEWLWISVAENLSELVLKDDIINSDDKKPLLSLIDETIPHLRFCLLFIGIKTYDKKVRYYIPIITHLLNIINKLQISSREDFKKIRNLLLITLTFIKSFQEESNNDISTNDNDINNEEENNLKEDKNNNNNLIIDESILHNFPKNKSFEKILNKFTNSILNYQEFYINILKELLKIEKNNQITKIVMNIFKQCTELMIRLEAYSQETELPQWINYLEKIIFNINGNLSLSLEAANYLLDLNLSTLSDYHIYKKIKNNFKNEEISNSIIDNDYLNFLIKKTGVQKNCFELLLAKLYLIIKEQSCQKIIIDLLMKIANLDKDKFINILSNTFNLENSDSDVESLKLFSDYWKLENEFYPNSNFFPNGECIFKMIDYLEHKNPLIRHLSRSWLNLSEKHFSKIIDPLLLVLLKDNAYFIQKDNQIFFEKEYESSRIIDAFSKLKNIILNSSVMNFFKLNTVNKNLLKKDIINNVNVAYSTYLSLLISISLSFIRLKCAENLDENFKIENHSVNAASCEFLELLLSHTNNKELLLKYASEINLPILLKLDEAIDNNDEVMQVQLLAVLRVLYFQSSQIHLLNKSNHIIALSLFQNETLIKVLIKGMTRDYFFVREYFIKFTKELLPIFRNVMGDINGIKNLYNVGSNFISSLITYLSKRINIDRIGRKDTEKFSHFDMVNNTFIFKNYLEEYKEYKRYDENDILLILKGIKDIFFYFLDIKNQNGKNINGENSVNNNNNNFQGSWSEYKKNLISIDKTSSSFIEFFSNFFDSNDFDKQEQNEEISYMPKNLYSNQIFNLLNGFILIWINQSEKYEVYDYCLNNNGILAFQEIETWNKISDEEIKKTKEDINKQPINKIIIEIALNLFITNPIEFIENILLIWYMTSSSNNKMNASIDKQYKLSIIELLISLDIPLNLILYCIGKIIQKNNSRLKNQIYKKDYIYKCISTPYQISLYEAQILHFIYSYILLNPLIEDNIIYNKDPKDNESVEIWKEMINILNIFITDSKILYSYCWIYEIMQLTLQKTNINSINENNDIKKGIINIFGFVTNKLIDSSIYNKPDTKYTMANKIVLPFLPHIYTNIANEFYYENLYKKIIHDIKKNDNNKNEDDDNNNQNGIGEFIEKNKEKFDDQKHIKDNVNKFYGTYCFEAKLSSSYLDPQFAVPIPVEKLNDYYRKLALITLKENFAKIISGIFFDSKKYLIDLLKGLIMLIKENNDEFLSEFSTDFIVSLMKDCPKNTTICGKNLFMDFLDDPSFFVTTPKKLRNWRKIISSSTDYYPEILTDLINNIDKGFLFVKGSDEDKMKTLRRISFVIYSCDKDTFQKQFDLIRTKAKDFLSGYNNNTLLESEIFLMMRILFLRFSHEGVMKMIRDLWPIIFMELLENIENESRNKQVKLVLESIKFIELLSLANIEEFSLYQWIFILDTYDMNNLDLRNKKSLLSILLSDNCKIFKPIVVNLLDKEGIIIDEKLLEGKHKSKSELFINIKNEKIQDLQQAVKNYFYAIGDMNSYKVNVNYGQIEEVIEKDFVVEENVKNR